MRVYRPQDLYSEMGHKVSQTGLTSNPTTYDQAIKNNDFYDETIRQKIREGKSGEGLFFELALRRLNCTAERSDLTSSSIFPAPRKDFRPSRRRSLKECR